MIETETQFAANVVDFDKESRQLLIERQTKIARSRGLEPEDLSSLRLCDECEGRRFKPTIHNIGSRALVSSGIGEPRLSDDDEIEGQNGQKMMPCEACDATGIMFGYKYFTRQSWKKLNEYFRDNFPPLSPSQESVEISDTPQEPCMSNKKRRKMQSKQKSADGSNQSAIDPAEIARIEQQRILKEIRQARSLGGPVNPSRLNQR